MSRIPPPRMVLWAWERPENLSYIDPANVGVAFLAQTVHLLGDEVEIRPRLQPLQVPKGTILLAVVRISTSHSSKPTLSNDQLHTTEESILEVAHTEGIQGLQIDFDATVSERAFYRSLIDSLRCRLPDSLSLSITALTSWCLGDPWIADLPVDDAVPMLFRLGPDRYEVLDRLEQGKDFSAALARRSVGISTDEPWPPFRPDRRVYVFNPHPWDSETYQRVLKELTR